MNIETLHIIATFYFRKKVRTNCDFVKILNFREEKGNYEFFGLYKCNRGVGLKKVILTPTGDCVDIISF